MPKEQYLETIDVPAELTDRPGFLLRKAHQVAVAIFTEEARHLSLTPPQHNVLSAVARFPGCSQSEISRAVGYDRATIGAVLVGLEARHLVRRQSSPHDRRLKVLTLTRQGKELLQAAAPVTKHINHRVVEALSADERRVFIRCLAKIALSRKTDT